MQAVASIVDIPALHTHNRSYRYRNLGPIAMSRRAIRPVGRFRPADRNVRGADGGVRNRCGRRRYSGCESIVVDRHELRRSC